VLDSVPDITMLDWLPDFLDGLFAMLSDSNREIRSAAEAAINGFLVDIANSKTVEFGPMVPILVDQCRAQDRARRCTAVTWVRQFIELGKSALLLFYSELLGSIMHCIADTDVEIRAVAGSADARLLSLVRETTDEFELSPLVQTLTQELQSTHVPTRLAALKWLTMLLAKAPVAMARFIGEVLPYLLVALSDDSDDVVLLDLEVLARIAVLDAAEFKSVLGAIVRLFRNDRRLLETRGSLIIRRGPRPGIGPKLWRPRRPRKTGPFRGPRGGPSIAGPRVPLRRSLGRFPSRGQSASSLDHLRRTGPEAVFRRPVVGLSRASALAKQAGARGTVKKAVRIGSETVLEKPKSLPSSKRRLRAACGPGIFSLQDSACNRRLSAPSLSFDGLGRPPLQQLRLSIQKSKSKSNGQKQKQVWDAASALRDVRARRRAHAHVRGARRALACFWTLLLLLLLDVAFLDVAFAFGRCFWFWTFGFKVGTVTVLP